MAREGIGSWLSGPSATTPESELEQYRGERLGLPPSGPGSVAGWGRRTMAIVIDWFAAIALARLALRGGSPDAISLATLGIFALHVTVLTGLAGASFGQRLLGLAVRRADGGAVGLLGALIRTVLICLVIPPLVWDRDGRGLHDRAANSVVIRTR